jgi:hypothetical protein
MYVSGEWIICEVTSSRQESLQHLFVNFFGSLTIIKVNAMYDNIQLYGLIFILMYETQVHSYCHVVCVTVDGVLDWILDLLTTYRS